MATENENQDAGDQSQGSGGGLTAVKTFLFSQKYDTVSWLLRLYILFSAFCFMVPVLGFEFGQLCFRRVLLGNAAVSALRLHQRLPRVQLNMVFFRSLLGEDSFHYLAYSVLFLVGSAGVSIALMPVVTFAVLHATTYTRKVLEVSRSENSLMLKIRQWCSKIENRETQTQMLQFIALMEIMIFPASILLLFSGRGTLIVPLFYYRFLQLRYYSRRNPYSRVMFSQLRLTIDRLAYHPRCPAIGKKLLNMIVNLACRLAPQQQEQQQPS